MKIQLLNPSALCQIMGAPPVETFSLTQKQLRAWNRAKVRAFGISFNESFNSEQGLPCEAAMRWLSSLHSSKFGTLEPSGEVTWSDVRNAMEKARR